MMRVFSQVPMLALLAGSATLSAQAPVLDLRRAPDRTVREPFSVISSVAELDANLVAVADPTEERLALVNLATGAVQAMGRKGGGPGEWQSLAMILTAFDGKAYVGDPIGRTVHRLSATGRLEASGILPGQDAGASAIGRARGVDANGRVYYQAALMVGAGSASTGDSVSILRLAPGSREAARVAAIGSPARQVTTRTSTGMSMSVRVPPMAASDAWVVLPDGRLAIVRAAPYRLDLVEVNGSVRAGPTISYEPVRVTGRERDAWREQMAGQRPQVMSFGGGASGGGPQPRVTRTPVPDDEFPKVMPPFLSSDGVRLSPAGEIWVLRSRAASDSTPMYDVLSTDGALRRRVALRPHSRVVGFGAGAVYVARKDPSDDLTYLEAYRL
jgi:hypothetical protein